MAKFHFIFGLKEQTEPLHLLYFLCLATCRYHHPQAEIHFWYRHLPHGPYWERAHSDLSLQLHQVGDIGFARLAQRYDHHQEGRFIVSNHLSYAHEADLLRLQILHTHGGGYVDIDTLFIAPYPERFWQAECLLGEEDSLPATEPSLQGILQPSLCNAVILAQPGAAFIRTWLERMEHSFDGSWSNHSCQEAARIWTAHPDWCQLLPARSFYGIGWSVTGFQNLFEHCVDLHAMYSIHLWSHLWWSPERNDFSNIHAQMIDEAWLKTHHCTLSQIVKPIL
ncbi:MAG: hypothetical protein RLZZ502_408 [Pseudomonadota bacterium]|jgi:hypothetical protein